MIAVVRSERPAVAADVDAAIAAIERGPGVWLGCDVDVPGLYRREASAALDPLLAFYLDGRLLRVVPHGGLGRALAEQLLPLAPFERVEGRLELRFAAGEAQDGIHPAIVLLRQVLALFETQPAELGLYGALAFDYYRLSRADDLPDDGRRRVALILPRRVLRSGDAGARWVEFDFPGLAPLDGPQAEAPAARLERHADDHPPGGHARAVARGVELMQRGALCSLVLSQTFRRQTIVDAADAFARLRRDNPYPAMFFVNAGGGERVFGASPDIQVRANAQWVETAPVCGTFRRGADAVDDYAQAKGLVTSAVDEASLAVCADSDRNDKALVCVPGSVEQVSRRRIHFFSTIIHAIDHTRGRRRADVDGFDIVLAHATPATVTGMPKRVARQAIAEIEPGWRGWYAGAAVRIGADGGCEALTMLRFARLVDGWAEVRTGGSLLADSDPVREEEETQLKAQTMFRVLAGQSPRAATPATAAARSHAVRYVDGGDALDALAREALVQAGARFDEAAALTVLGDGPLDALRERQPPAGPLLGLNNAALALLAQDGAALEPLTQPQFGRALPSTAAADGPLAALGDFDAGLYTAWRITALPPGWTLSARGADGRVVAAVHAGRRAVALLFRPDATVSLRHAAGRRCLAAALDWLEP
jgi:anthranilate synthase